MEPTNQLFTLLIIAGLPRVKTLSPAAHNEDVGFMGASRIDQSLPQPALRPRRKIRTSTRSSDCHLAREWCNGGCCNRSANEVASIYCHITGSSLRVSSILTPGPCAIRDGPDFCCRAAVFNVSRRFIAFSYDHCPGCRAGVAMSA